MPGVGGKPFPLLSAWETQHLAASSVVVTRALGYNTCLFLKNVARPFKSAPWTGSKDSSRDQPPWCFLKKQLLREEDWGTWIAMGLQVQAGLGSWGKVGRRSSLQLPVSSSSFFKTPLSQEHLRKMDGLPSCLGKLGAGNRSAQECGAQPLGRMANLPTI